MTEPTRDFFLKAPPGFKPFREIEPVDVYTRKLPHWRQADCTYFVTFRTADSLPQSARRQLVAKRKDWEEEHPPPWSEELKVERAMILTQLEEDWLDAGHGECPFALELHRGILEDALLHAASAQMETHAFVCMPNHVHALFRPHDGQRLEEGLKRIKGRSSVQVNRSMNQRATLWFDENFDRIVRDREHLWRCLQYLGRNPVQAKLPRERTPAGCAHNGRRKIGRSNPRRNGGKSGATAE